MIILDFETNSTNIHDVIEVAAFRVALVNNTYKVLDTFHRYYFSPYEVNPHALAVHKLTPQKIEKLRLGVSYEAYFEDDADFIAFCKNTSTLVAHNISFELRHIGKLLSFEKHFLYDERKQEGSQSNQHQRQHKEPKTHRNVQPLPHRF